MARKGRKDSQSYYLIRTLCLKWDWHAKAQRVRKGGKILSGGDKFNGKQRRKGRKGKEERMVLNF